MRSDVRLRAARIADAYALWIWANDGETRRASHGREPVAWAAHRSWMQERLATASALVLVAETEDEQPVGHVRFETADDWATARLSYLVAPESRGMGFARGVVQGGVERLTASHPGVRVFADVMRTNVRSASVFRALGWKELEDPDGPLRFWYTPNGRGV